MLTIEDFKKIELKVAKVIKAERVEGSDKLVKLEITAGDTDESGAPKNRQIVAGIGKSYSPEELLGREIIIVANLEPKIITLRPIRKTQGRPEEIEGRQGSGQVVLESQGMLLAAACDEIPILLGLDKEVPPGTKIR